MRFTARIRRRIGNLLGRQRLEESLDEELRTYVEEIAGRKVREGVAPAEARRQALIELGGMEQVKEEVRETWLGHGLETAVRDVRFALRMLARKPAFAAAAAATLVLGIGANTAVFSLVNAVLLKPLNVRHPETLIGCYVRDSREPDSWRASSYLNYAELREHRDIFSQLSAHDLIEVRIAAAGNARRVTGDLISSDYFDTLGVTLASGRTFTAEEEKPGQAEPCAIISDELARKIGGGAGLVGNSRKTGRPAPLQSSGFLPPWRRGEARPFALLGSRLQINGRAFTVVGITRPGFTGATRLLIPDVYLPLGMYGAVDNSGSGPALMARDNRVLTMVGRLRPGLTQQAANEQLAAISVRIAAASRAGTLHDVYVVRPLTRLGDSVNPGDGSAAGASAVVILCMGGAVLLIAALNVAAMMLARAVERRREIAIRLAVGAGRGRLVAQLVTESLVLSLIGGVGALLLASAGTSLLKDSLARVLPVEVELALSPALDPNVLIATLVFCCGATVVFGLGPAWQLSKPDLAPTLKGSVQTAPGKPYRLLSASHLLAAAQLAMSLVLLTVAMRHAYAAFRATRVRTGMGVENVMVLQADPPATGLDSKRASREVRDLATRLGDVPGVVSTTISATIPFSALEPVVFVRGLTAAGQSAGEKDGAKCRLNSVGMRYFRTLGIPLLRGRDFRAEEVAAAGPDVVILDQAAAERLWPHREVIGQHVRIAGGDTPRLTADAEVVGVAANVRDEPGDTIPVPHIYAPFGQQEEGDLNVYLRVRPGGMAGGSFLKLLRDQAPTTDPALTVQSVRSLQSHMDGGLGMWAIRARARLFGAISTIALLLATLGLYAVRTYAVTRRTREIGIRMALGASVGGTVRRILGEGLLITALGSAAGAALSIIVEQVLNAISHRLGGFEILPFGAAVLVLCGVSTLACFIPARRAARIDPLIAFRCE